MEYKDLIGKTIECVSQKKLKGSDDEGYLELKFTDGTIATVVAYYEEWTGKSEGEYPANIYVTDKLDDLENIEPESIFCDDCGEEIHGLYEDNKDGSYTCVPCLIKRDDGYVIDNEMGCDW